MCQHHAEHAYSTLLLQSAVRSPVFLIYSETFKVGINNVKISLGCQVPTVVRCIIIIAVGELFRYERLIFKGREACKNCVCL